ncbi:hypothetical protein EIP91_002429 [Steccherinum ochraceum]|uniref:Protein N-terminal glutamine amidohydrolase n=1 Tax=Steccherinum ochraceum TaxID=92696 RepID=A0A4R0RSZ2_9APHY|nr:hypothetical protein EIP91_002429 [Steccherinum ochraceum]
MGDSSSQQSIHPYLSPPRLPANTVYTSCYCEENIYLLAQALQDGGPEARHWEAFAVFISNQSKTVALWNQQARDGVVVWDYHVVLVVRPINHASDDPSQRDQAEVTSDIRPSCWVYDFDTRLPMPCESTGTFPYCFLGENAIDARYIRVVPAQVYLDNFASDRSHMIIQRPLQLPEDEENGEVRAEDALAETLYSCPPPPYPPLRGDKAKTIGVLHNLMDSFVSMKRPATSFGVDQSRKQDSTGAPVTAAVVDTYGEVMDISTFVLWVKGEIAEV